jgi:hypothetical protein
MSEGRAPVIAAPASGKAADKLAAQVGLRGDPYSERTQARIKRLQAKNRTSGGFIELKYKDWALAPSTVNRRVTTLKAVLNKAVKWDVISINPLSKIKPLKIDKK